MKYDVRISNILADGAIKAYASVNLGGEFAITGVKIMDGSKGTFVAMPSYKSNGEYKDVCLPVTKEAREQFNAAVLNAYEQALSHLQGKSQEQTDIPTQTQDMAMN